MRLLHVVPSYIPAWRYGGPIHSVHGLCKALAARGHTVDVATTNIDGQFDSEVPLGVPVPLDGVNVHYFPSRILRRIYYSPPLGRFLADAMAKWDLVHNHSVFLWPTTKAANVARRRSKPYVVSPRGMLVGDLIRRRSTLAKRAWLALFEQSNIARAAAIHVTSEVEGRELAALGLVPRRVFEVPNGIDLPETEQLTPRNLDLPARYILFLGRISWKKGLDRLIRAVASVPDVHLVVAGNDEEGILPGLEGLARELHIHTRVHFVGFADGVRKRELLERAEALALASYSENFAIVVLEAMAAGVPVVITPEVGMSLSVRNSGSGIVAEGDPRSFGAALGALWSNHELRHQLGRQARLASRAYSWPHVAARFETEYQRILAPQPSAS